MIRADIETVVKRPIAEVFDYCADFENLPGFDRYVMSVTKTSAGPIGVGSAWTHQRRQGPQKIVAPITLTLYDRPHRFEMDSGSGGFEVHSTMTFEPIDDGSTRIHEVLEMKTKGLTRLFEPVIRRQVPKQSTEVHESLKSVLESRQTPS
jgi:uncharacterized membrane protein